MGTLASGSIDLKSLKVAGESNKYVTYINDEGVRVHEANDTSNYSLVNASGMEVYQGGVSVADFGRITRIGLKNEASIILSSDSIMGKGLNGLEYFNFQASSNSIISSKSESAWTGSFPSSLDTALTVECEPFSDTANVALGISSVDYDYHYGVETTFSYGTSATKNLTVTLNNIDYTVICTYDGAYTFSAYSPELNHVNARGSLFVSYQVTTIAPGYIIGYGTATGGYSLAEGYETTATGNYSHAEGYKTTATGNCSHTEGYDTIATGNYSHAEGYKTTAGTNTTTGSIYAYTHAEGERTEASGYGSHAEGQGTKARGHYSHAEGQGTEASGLYSHAGGYETIAGYESQTVIGKYNNNKSTNLFEIGGGTSSTRRNVFEVDTSGNVNIPSGAEYKINGTALAASNVGAVSTSDVSTTGGANKVIKSDSSGNIVITGNLTLGGHTTSIGSTLTATNSAQKSISADGSTTLATLSNLPIGTWVIECNIRFSNTANGIRRGGLLASGSSLGTSNMDFQVGAATTAAFVKQTFTKVITTTAVTTYNLIGYSSVAVTVGAGEANIKAVRLC